MSSYVGPYRVLRLINRGAQGSVYLGFDERLQRRVAIKIHQLPDERASRKALQREARLVAEIESPKIVKVHDVIQSRRYLAMVMEYVPGCSLEDFLRLARPSLASVVTVAIDVAGALATARQHRVVHGDLKAANVLITESGHAKLTDFGIARRAGAMQSRSSPGSFSSMSPEQFAGDDLTTAADLFALGILLYRMLSGEHPFMHEGVMDTKQLVSARERPLAEVVPHHIEVPEVLLTLVDELLRKDPAMRPRNTVRVRQVLREVTRSLPLASQRSLGGEAKPYFRGDGSEDVATRIPMELGRDGRSRLPPKGGFFPSVQYWLAGLPDGWRIALGVGVLLLLLSPVFFVLNTQVTTVLFDEPELSFSDSFQAPRGFSALWLIEQVKIPVAAKLGNLRVLGTLGADHQPAVYGARETQVAVAQPDEQFSIAVRCLADVCILSFRRSGSSVVRTAQGVLFPSDGLQQWGQTVRDVTRQLFSR